jgi:membrane-bound lytic murein transglycosylase B
MGNLWYQIAMLASVFACGFLIIAFIARWNEYAKRNEKFRQAQTDLLKEMARQQGVSAERIDQILAELNKEEE